MVDVICRMDLRFPTIGSDGVRTLAETKDKLLAE
jgi:hypothetical protein